MVYSCWFTGSHPWKNCRLTLCFEQTVHVSGAAVVEPGKTLPQVGASGERLPALKLRRIFQIDSGEKDGYNIP